MTGYRLEKRAEVRWDRVLSWGRKKEFPQIRRHGLPYEHLIGPKRAGVNAKPLHYNKKIKINQSKRFLQNHKENNKEQKWGERGAKEMRMHILCQYVGCFVPIIVKNQL